MDVGSLCACSIFLKLVICVGLYNGGEGGRNDGPIFTVSLSPLECIIKSLYPIW